MTPNINDLMIQSNMILLGYTFKYERKKDEFLSQFKTKEIEFEDIKDTTSLRQKSRDDKVNFILEDKELPQFLLVDLTKVSNDLNISKSNKINNVLRNFNKGFFKIILVSPMYRNVSDNNLQFRSPEVLVYMCDIALRIDEKIDIIKNRFGNK